MRSLPGAAEVANRILLPGVRRDGHAGSSHERPADLPDLPTSMQRHGWDPVRQDPYVAEGVVRRGVVHHQPETRRQRAGAATGSRLEQLPDRLGYVAQVSASDGAP